jgi:hypothetical protein
VLNLLETGGDADFHRADLAHPKRKPGQRKHPLTWLFRSGDRI